jgi:hypothetical protein
MASNRFSESHGIVPMVTAGDYGSGFSMETVRMSKYNHGTLIIYGASIVGNGKLTMMAGATDEAETAAITFTYRYASAATESASADVLGTAATSAELTITGASLTETLLIVEWDAEDMVVSGITYDYMTPVLDASGTSGTVNAICILSEPRYAKAVMPTAIPTS